MPRTNRPRRLRVNPKKEPSQERSRLMVRRILDAALIVLTRDGVERFTINHVAAEAGISVASIYQFFPNKQAIIYRLYQDWLAEVNARLEAAIAAGSEDTDWRQFAARLADALSADVVEPDAEHELVRAMWSHRELHDLDRQHSMALGTRVAGEMRRFGASLPGVGLERLALFANELFTLVAERAGLGGESDRVLLTEFARTAYVQLWASAFAAAPAAAAKQTTSHAGRRRTGA